MAIQWLLWCEGGGTWVISLLKGKMYNVKYWKWNKSIEHFSCLMDFERIYIFIF